ncbi:Hypothetical predicted protein [Podarcis lilfordi]|uniref:Uncharacterized protein n=1 Tax=Podarcis lilfordi TaxID=74358 RepID=A0AA35NXB0_9SAUR|nr:Hypothetical predicted protein [Podarcis lilfordi]
MPSDGPPKGNVTHRKPETDLSVFEEDPPMVPAIHITPSMPGNWENAATQPREQHLAYPKNGCITTKPVGELITIPPPTHNEAKPVMERAALTLSRGT